MNHVREGGKGPTECAEKRTTSLLVLISYMMLRARGWRIADADRVITHERKLHLLCPTDQQTEHLQLSARQHHTPECVFQLIGCKSQPTTKPSAS